MPLQLDFWDCSQELQVESTQMPKLSCCVHVAQLLLVVMRVELC